MPRNTAPKSKQDVGLTPTQLLAKSLPGSCGSLGQVHARLRDILPAETAEEMAALHDGVIATIPNPRHWSCLDPKHPYVLAVFNSQAKRYLIGPVNLFTIKPSKARDALVLAREVAQIHDDVAFTEVAEDEKKAPEGFQPVLAGIAQSLESPLLSDVGHTAVCHEGVVVVLLEDPGKEPTGVGASKAFRGLQEEMREHVLSMAMPRP